MAVELAPPRRQSGHAAPAGVTTNGIVRDSRGFPSKENSLRGRRLSGGRSGRAGAGFPEPTAARGALRESGRVRVESRRRAPIARRGSERRYAWPGLRYGLPVGEDARLMTLVRAIARGDRAHASALLATSPELALARVAVGTTRQAAEDCWLVEITHYVYGGDTALHIAAAAYDAGMVRELITSGAIARAANRRGAQPLHYAVDGIPASPRWNPVAQRDTVQCLVGLGADPNAVDKNGTTPLHRAVRNRCAAAVKVLLDGGADPHATNRSGSTAADLAHWTTGRGGSGSPAATAQQVEIIELLRASGGT